MDSKVLAAIIFIAIAVPSVFGQAPDPNKGHYHGEDHDAKYDHEAFLGKEEAAEYDQLKPEEAKEKLGKLIPKLDKNSDGQVSIDELKNHILYMQQGITHKLDEQFVKNETFVLANVERAWNMFGAKLVNDKIGWDVYREMVYAPHEKAGKEPPKEFVEAEARDKRRWKNADGDGDGVLHREEYRCFIHPETCPHMTDAIVQETLELGDHNKDGFIDVNEYIAQYYRPEDYPELKGKEPEWVKHERKGFQDLRDKNKDGMLNEQELRAWIMPSNEERADQESKHLLHMADDNKDMSLSPAEFQKHWQAFVGSTATHYGEQLKKHDVTEL